MRLTDEEYDSLRFGHTFATTHWGNVTTVLFENQEIGFVFSNREGVGAVVGNFLFPSRVQGIGIFKDQRTAARSILQIWWNSRREKKMRELRKGRR